MSKQQAPFVWGTATASYQIEGAWLEGGKGLSIWDAFTHIPGKILNGDTGDVACDHYHRVEEDVQHLAHLGVSGYRFSIAWTRIIPDGSGEPNAEGIAFYNKLIDALLAENITPFVTLYHWDLPLALQLEHNGWLGSGTVNAFEHYAKTCFDAFGDRVHHWITFNENWVTCVFGYGVGRFAPGRISRSEPYTAAHNLLIAHGRAVRAFRDGNYPGVIGITNCCDWREPLTDSAEDRAAAQESLESFFGWHTDPIVFGDYPEIMRERVGDRLPQFTDEERDLVKDSTDFIGLNHYSTLLASRKPAQQNAMPPLDSNGGVSQDQQVYLSFDPSWERTAMGWFVVPEGFRSILKWIGRRYPNIPIYVTENGCSVLASSREEAINDDLRVRYLKSYTDAMCKAINEDGIDVRGYFVWSLLDNFEWAHGFQQRFGLVHCDFETLERTPKNSFKFVSELTRTDPRQS